MLYKQRDNSITIKTNFTFYADIFPRVENRREQTGNWIHAKKIDIRYLTQILCGIYKSTRTMTQNFVKGIHAHHDNVLGTIVGCETERIIF